MTNNPIIVALDVSSGEAAAQLVGELSGDVGAFKVGLELFNAVGPRIFEALLEVDPQAKFFYDAKFHDIPNTVAGAVRAAILNDLWMLNLHASGGRAMMSAAVHAAKSATHSPFVIAVTVLTSLDAADLTDIGVIRTPNEQVVELALLAKESGCDGVVASPHEIRTIRAACGDGFLIVTPGVRPVGAALSDQKRVMTPGEAMSHGADYIVIGRPITAAVSPAAAARAIVDEIDHSRLLMQSL